MRVVIESPLSGDFVRNFRYLLWCCRAVWLREKAHSIASHMLNPWFMDDTNATEREAGIENPWVWSKDIPHIFFTDLGLSSGMMTAHKVCTANGITPLLETLRDFHPESWEAFSRGDWPPHTPGFELKRATK